MLCPCICLYLSYQPVSICNTCSGFLVYHSLPAHAAAALQTCCHPLNHSHLPFAMARCSQAWELLGKAGGAHSRSGCSAAAQQNFWQDKLHHNSHRDAACCPFLLVTDCRLVHVQATAALQTYCQQELSSIHSRVHVAQQLQTLDMSLQTPTYQALLSKELLSGVALRSMGQYKLGWVKGISRPSSQQVSKCLHRNQVAEIVSLTVSYGSSKGIAQWAMHVGGLQSASMALCALHCYPLPPAVYICICMQSIQVGIKDRLDHTDRIAYSLGHITTNHADRRARVEARLLAFWRQTACVVKLTPVLIQLLHCRRH